LNNENTKMMNLFRLKYISFCFVVVTLLLNSCNNKNSISVSVKIKSSKDSKIFLDKLNFSNSVVLDSSEISKGENNISFKVKSVLEPTFLVVRVNDSGSITLLCEPGEKMDLIINIDKFYDYSILGSKGSQKTKELAAKLSDTKNKLYYLGLKYKLSQDTGEKKLIEQEYSAVIDSQRVFSTKFIWANAMSRASVMAAYQKYDDESYVLDQPQDLVLFKTVASSLRAIYPNSDYTKGMIAEIKKMEGIIRNSKLTSLISQSTTTIPEIELPNPLGEKIKLSKYNGNVVLLSFWASWDQTSLMDNRELLDIYNQFKKRGFEIYQVSLDSNRDEWVNAIESAGLPWVNVSELNPNGSVYARTYNITQLPANYLIDRNQTIIGKNLYGEALKKKLREIL
jgi:peroxiredoxin